MARGEVMNLPSSDNKRIAKYYAKLGHYLEKIGDASVTHKQTFDGEHFVSYVLDFHYGNGRYHGEVRTADTWDRKNGWQVPLYRLFKRKRGIKRRIIKALQAQLNADKAVKKRLEHCIDEEKFYLSDDGLHVFTADNHDFMLPYETLHNLVTPLSTLQTTPCD